MIITLFITFFSIAMIFLFYGHHADDPTITTMGWSFFLLPAFVLSGLDAPLIDDTPGIQYPDGDNVNITYTYAANSTTQITSLFEAKTQKYSTYTNRFYGIAFLFIISMGLWMSITSIKNTPNTGRLPRINWRFYR